MTGKIFFCGIFICISLVSNGQKLWERVFNQTKQNTSFTMDSDIFNDSIIVISGFTNAMSCYIGIIHFVDTNGNVGSVSTGYDLFPGCNSLSCNTSFRFVKATENYIYSVGEARVDLISGSEPVFLHKFDPAGELEFSVAFHNTEQWGYMTIWETLAMDACDENGVIVAHSFEANNNGIIKFDTDGNVQWDKLYGFPIQEIVFTEGGNFIVYTGTEIHLLNEAGDIQRIYDNAGAAHSFLYIDQDLYFSDSSHVFKLDLRNEYMDTLFLLGTENAIQKIKLIDDTLWIAYADDGKLIVLSINTGNPEVYKLPTPAFEVNNFFITKESIILTGTTKQQLMAAIAYERKETEPDFDSIDIELVDFDISNMVIHYEDCSVFGPLFDHIKFDSQITVKNNGTDTIYYFELQSNKSGGFSCYAYYYYKYFDDLALAPGESQVFNLGNNPDYNNVSGNLPYIFRLSYQLMAPNSRIEKNIKNNYLAKTFDITNIPELYTHEAWKVYPNPATHYLTLEAPVNTPFQYQIFSIEGRLIISGEKNEGQNTLDVSDLPPGMYFIRLQQDSDIRTLKFLRQ